MTKPTLAQLRKKCLLLPPFRPYLLDAVIAGTKNRTMRIHAKPRYRVGDIVAAREPLAAMTRPNNPLLALSLLSGYSDGLIVDPPLRWKWQRNRLPQMFMPKSAARHFYRIERVHEQRPQDLSEEECIREGVEPLESTLSEGRESADFDSSLCPRCGGLRLYMRINPIIGGVDYDVDCTVCDTHKKRFEHLWSSINDGRVAHGVDCAWGANPLCQAYEWGEEIEYDA